MGATLVVEDDELSSGDGRRSACFKSVLIASGEEAIALLQDAKSKYGRS